uniref:Uncharacterized protein n=1 Tax=Anguilla anguilla TaxID=7936 RepID=A0A0E9PY75_ANGAN
MCSSRKSGWGNTSWHCMQISSLLQNNDGIYINILPVRIIEFLNV